MRRLAHVVVGHPWLVILAWLAAAAAIVLLGPSYASAAQASIGLPASSEAARADRVAATAFGDGDRRPIASVVTEDVNGAGALRGWLAGVPDVAGVGPAVPSRDGTAVLLPVTFDSGGAALDGALDRIERHLAGTSAGVAGGAAIGHDFNSTLLGTSSSSTLSPLRLLTVLVVLLVLALVYRAPLAVLVPLACIGMVIAIVPHVVAAAAIWLHAPLGNFSLPFMFAITLGAGTNYGLFLISRYREQLGRGRQPRAALEEALTDVGEAITSSAATVILAMLAMLFATFDLFRTLGPAIAITIALMLLAGLTLMPALIAVCGHAFLWPWRPHAGAAPAERGAWRRIGGLVSRRPALVAGACAAVLLPAAAAASIVRPSFDLVRSLPVDGASARGQALLERHFPQELATLDLLVAPAGRAGAVRAAVQGLPDVGSVPAPEAAPDGSVARLQVQLAADPDSLRAAGDVDAVERAARHAAAGAQVLATGEPAATRDLRDLLAHDFALVAALVAVSIYLVLALLLRDLLAPLYLLATVGLTFAVAVGAVALAFQLGPGLPVFWPAPVFAFVFLVALGEDFNIFLMARLRREVAEHGPAEGVARAVGATGGVITSCGLVMAAAFLLLARNPVGVVQQVGLAVVVGVLLDTFVVRGVLVPALARLARTGVRQPPDRSQEAAWRVRG